MMALFMCVYTCMYNVITRCQRSAGKSRRRRNTSVWRVWGVCVGVRVFACVCLREDEHRKGAEGVKSPPKRNMVDGIWDS